MTLSVVIPVFNEQANIEQLVERSVRACDSYAAPYEIILVDDGSSDASVELITQKVAAYPGRVVGVMLNRNYGQHAAIMAGFEHSKGRIVITLDADLQNPPEEIPRLAAKAAEGHDVVGSVRTPRHDPLFRKISSAIINRVVQKATGVRMTDYGCMLRAYRRRIVDAMLQCHERSTFIPILANTFARTSCEIEVKHSPRALGDSKYNLWKLINLQFDLLTSMTTFPLRVLSVVGGCISAAAMGFGLLLLVLRLWYGPGWAVGGVFTLFAVLFFVVGTQFVAMGLLGEYIGRIYSDVRARPRYFVDRIEGEGL